MNDVMTEPVSTLSSRREFLFLYDIKMGNPNGDPDENRPRVLPDGTHYITDVRLKRFVRDYFKLRGREILVDNIEGRTTNLTGRVKHFLEGKKRPKAEGKELVDILLDGFIDARLFGSSFAFKKEDGWEPKAEPKTLTGAVQVNMGEVLHKAEEVDIHGTSVFASDSEKTQGTFTTFFGLRYALIGFSGIANEHSACRSRLTDADYELYLEALWNGVRAAANTRTKKGQMPHFLLDVQYKPGEEFQFGRLQEYLHLESASGKSEKEWATPADFRIDISKLAERLKSQEARIAKIRLARSPDITLFNKNNAGWTCDWLPVDFNTPSPSPAKTE